MSERRALVSKGQEQSLPHLENLTDRQLRYRYQRRICPEMNYAAIQIKEIKTMSFENDVKAGTNAERIFYTFEGRFSRRNILWPTWEAAMHITGKDFQELVIADEGIRTLKTEVKACLSNHFIERNNNPKSAPDPVGHLNLSSGAMLGIKTNTKYPENAGQLVGSRRYFIPKDIMWTRKLLKSLHDLYSCCVRMLMD